MKLSLGLSMGLFILSALPGTFAESFDPNDSDNPHCSQKKDGLEGSACYVKCEHGKPDPGPDYIHKGDPWCYLKGGDHCHFSPTCARIDPMECDGECHGSPG